MGWKKEKVKWHGKIKDITQVTLRQDIWTEKEFWKSTKDIIRENLSKTKSKADKWKPKQECIKDPSRMAKWAETELLNGMMEKNILANFYITKCTETAKWN